MSFGAGADTLVVDGGAVAAPVFAQVMQGALRMLNAPHDAPLEPVPFPGEGDELKEST